MKEVYIINCETDQQVVSVNMLSKSIRHFDSTREIVVATPLAAELFLNQVTIHNYELSSNPTLNYFKAVVDVKCDRAIYFKTDQLLTHFTTDCWETLRNLSSIVTLKTRLNFAGNEINPDVYYQDNINLSTLKDTKNINAVYFDFSKNARQLLGFCIDFCSDYDYNKVQDFSNELKQQEVQNFLPAFPEFIWPSWVISFVSLLFDEDFIEFDFLDNIDLSLQEYNITDSVWSNKSWNQFLSFWVTEQGQIKIENFIQSGLIKYQNTAWLNDNILGRIQRAYD